MAESQLTQLRVDCATGQAAEVALDPGEAEIIREQREQAVAEQAAQLRREKALNRLKYKAALDETLNDLLIVLGLEA